MAVSLGTSAAASKAFADTDIKEAEVASSTVVPKNAEATQINIVTKNEIRIEGFIRHEMHGSIGNGFDLIGVGFERIYDALINPLEIKEVKTGIYGRIS